MGLDVLVCISPYVSCEVGGEYGYILLIGDDLMPAKGVEKGRSKRKIILVVTLSCIITGRRGLAPLIPLQHSSFLDFCDLYESCSEDN